MRVLIIDDQEDARFLLAAILEPFGWDIVEAEDCQAGFEILTSQPKFDLALVDWKTPRMTGLEFVKNVRTEDALKELLIIMTTGMNDLENVSDALSQGVNEYIMKPFTEDMVLDKIKMVGIDLPE